MRKKLLGFGVNDATYKVSVGQSGDQIVCPYYKTWYGMLTRCYSKSYLKRKPSYIGCQVCPEWLYFSNFKTWMEEQNWEGKQLDKDLLSEGSKVYSPKTCVFVTPDVNLFMTESTKSRGNFMLGVSYHKVNRKFVAASSSAGYLGSYDTELEAHVAYLYSKELEAIRLANIQDDALVSRALIKKYNAKLRRKQAVEILMEKEHE